MCESSLNVPKSGLLESPITASLTRNEACTRQRVWPGRAGTDSRQELGLRSEVDFSDIY